MPTFDLATSRASGCAACILAMTGVSSSGPLPQLPPNAWTPSSARAAAARSGETPIMVWPRVSKVMVAMMGIVGSAARTPSMAAVISARSDIVSIQMQSTPPAASEAACSAKPATASSCSSVPSGDMIRPLGPMSPATRAEPPAASTSDAEQDGGRPIQLVDAILMAREPKSEAIAAERIGEQDARARIDVAAVDATHDVGMRQVPDFGRIAELEAGLEEHGAHRAVGEDGTAAIKERRQSVGHREPSMAVMVRDAR